MPCGLSASVEATMAEPAPSLLDEVDGFRANVSAFADFPAALAHVRRAMEEV
jgi:hypothetical protein